MLIFLIVFLCFSLYKVRLSSFNQDYIERDQTTSIKGFFAIVVFFSHLRQYIQLSNGFLDFSFLAFINFFGQLMVTLFFFYSGYGIIKAYKTKDDYTKTFFRKRILKTLVHFDIVVALYMILSFVFKSNYSGTDYAFAWVGWTSLGNSNWFIFVMLALYLSTQIAFLIVKNKRPIITTGLVCVFSCALFFLLYFVGKESWWFDTIFCYSFGMIFACFEEKIKTIMDKSKLYNYGAVVVSFICFFISYFFAANILPSIVAKNLTALLFCLVVVILSTKVKIDNPILRWLGKYSFLIYICQRLPMIILSKIGITDVVMFVCISFALTIILSVLLNKIYNKLDKVLF